MTKLPNEARLILTRAIGEQEGKKVFLLVDRWLASSGPEWASSRLKSFRVAALQLRAGNPDIVRQIYQENSIRYNKKTLIPKGPMGYLVENFVRAQRPVAVRRADAGLRIYTSIRLDTISTAQYQKWYCGLTTASQANPSLLSSIEEYLYEFGVSLKPHLTPLGAPNLAELKPKTACHRLVKTPVDIKEEAYAFASTSLVTSVWIPPSLTKTNPCEELRTELIQCGANNLDAGHIAFIQEGGCKLRSVAVPNVWCQWLFQPLHKMLDKLIKTLPASSVHDQNKGGYFLKDALRRGTVHCFDLSSATDRFPLQLQTALLRGLGLSVYANALEEVSHGKWTYVTPVNSGDICWEVGQPMGLYGSFPLFHLAHYGFLRYIEKYIGLSPSVGTDRTFSVLGDDVVISDRLVASCYEQMMCLLGVELSKTKTIQSESLGEFAGFVVTKTNQQITGYRPYKSHREGSKSRAMNLMYSLGSKSKSLGKWWDINYPLFARTLSMRELDLSPIMKSDRKDGRPTRMLDSHLLGSLVNRVAYDLPFELSFEFDSLWRHQRYLLLGQQETLNSDGFAPKNLNPYGIRNPLDEDEIKHPNQLEGDPLFREVRERQKQSPAESSETTSQAPKRNWLDELQPSSVFD